MPGYGIALSRTGGIALSGCRAPGSGKYVKPCTQREGQPKEHHGGRGNGDERKTLRFGMEGSEKTDLAIPSGQPWKRGQEGGSHKSLWGSALSCAGLVKALSPACWAAVSSITCFQGKLRSK